MRSRLTPRLGVPVILLALVLAVGILYFRPTTTAPDATGRSTTTTTSVATTTTIGTVSTSCAPPSSAIAGLATIACPSPPSTWGTPPTMVIPTTPAPTRLEAADLIKGFGPPAKNGDRIILQYELGTYSTHRVVQSSWLDSSFTFYTFYLGQDQVVPGWDQGLMGIKAGGRRELIVPASLGYGANSAGPGVAPHDTLVYIVDIFKIN